MAGRENPTIATLDDANAAQQVLRSAASDLQHQIRDAVRKLIDDLPMKPEIEQRLEAIILATWRTQDYLKELRRIEREKS
jgi:hypothetical protein